MHGRDTSQDGDGDADGDDVEELDALVDVDQPQHATARVAVRHLERMIQYTIIRESTQESGNPHTSGNPHIRESTHPHFCIVG